MKTSTGIFEFTQLFRRLCLLFNKVYDDQLYDSYYESLKQFNWRSVTETGEKLIKSKKMFPRIADFYELIIEIENRERNQSFDKREAKECTDCNSQGVLFAAMKTPQTTYSYVFRCAACDNWRDQVGDFVPRVSRATLEDQGYSITIGG